MPELSLEARILDFARNAETGDFDDLALALFERQFATLPGYRRHCEALGASLETVKSWAEIPAIAAESSTAPQASGPREGNAPPESVEFENHILPLSLPELFETSRPRLIVGGVGASAARGSGAGEPLLDALAVEAPPQSFVSGPSLDAKGLRSWLGGRQRDRQPVALISDPSGFGRLVDVLERRAVKFRLPPGSEAFCVLQFPTATSTPADTWRTRLLPNLGLAAEACRRVLVGPSMATPLLELAAGSGEGFRRPHWVRTAPIAGGHLAIFDLAALDTPPRLVEATTEFRFVPPFPNPHG